MAGWVEAFPTRTETANAVAKKIIEEIFPRFGMPKVIGSDNGPAFVAQGMMLKRHLKGFRESKLEEMNWPQSSFMTGTSNFRILETWFSEDPAGTAAAMDVQEDLVY
ncbi:hypothetical protein U0070_015522 [Myodes glareolus]|uniref:Integrase catalytic domain-containing protein n=1 Tax=Myodes glareolus TaxID=447135 RepID=A0AAW0IGB3_MYOGA